jgi:serine/threonine protein phosphatase 1
MDKIITFAIGDVHGCLDKLDALIAVCGLISAGRDTRFVPIGDYVDRGTDPRGVVDRLIEQQRRHPAVSFASAAIMNRC